MVSYNMESIVEGFVQIGGNRVAAKLEKEGERSRVDRCDRIVEGPFPVVQEEKFEDD